MGRNRGKHQDESAAEISLKLHKELNVSKEEAFNFWNYYQRRKNECGDIKFVLNIMQLTYNRNIFSYFTALAMEIISKEIIEGINVDKKES